MMVLGMMGRSIVAAARMAWVLWPWTLGLLALDLAQSFAGYVGKTPTAVALVQVAGFAVTALVTLRFYAGHLDVDWRAVLADRAQRSRFVAWYCFIGLLDLIGLPQGLAGHVPPLAALVCELGAYYFLLRLIAVLPAVVAWRTWPGVDRIWNAGGVLAWRIALFSFVMMLIAGTLVTLAALAVHPDMHALTADRQRLAASLDKLGPTWLLVMSVVTALIEMVSFAFDVACFRVVSSTPTQRAT
ncbi:hypothetical protein [Tanticharoenia sakaeratensis]|nr:hypothetical protein [Tanticharoenia sakaeratensis]